MPRWSWNPVGDEWDEIYLYLVEYVKENDHSRVPASHKLVNGENLGKWVCRQRTNRNILPPDQIDALDSLKKWSWDPIGDDWKDAFEYLDQFFSSEKHARVPQHHHAEDGFKLGAWVARQRRNIDSLTPEQIKKLESLEGWSWDPGMDDWEEGFSYLEQYVVREGHSRVHAKSLEEGFTLGSWVARQRQKRKNADLPKHQIKIMGILSKEQIKRLEALKGWVWDATK